MAGEPLPHLRSKKSRWALALLALRNREVDRAWLSGLLWPDSTEKHALGALRTTIKDLRQALGPEAWRLTAPTGRTLHLDLSDSDFDVFAFDSALERGDYQAAVSLYTGRLLEGCEEDWVLVEREGREQQVVAAMESVAQAAYESGDFDGAAAAAKNALALEPLRESSLRLLMLALAGAGRLSELIDGYRGFRLLLRRELNCDPDPETVSLYNRLRRAARRALEPMQAEPSNPPCTYLIPQPLTRLIGRTSELLQIETRLRTNRLVTLTGAGGVGKTRLAIELAERLAPEFAWGACFVELAGITDPDLVPQNLRVALGLFEQPGIEPIETVLNGLLKSDLLLVLDNCEHLIGACAKVAEELLRTCSGLKILATSREALGITGEIQWRVPSLELPSENQFGEGSSETLSSALQIPSMALIHERAAQANNSYQLVESDLECAALICRKLDGIPLALEMAAARVDTMSLREISKGLDKLFELLSQGSRIALPRQRTLEAVIDWSYRLLSEPERRLLIRLSIFAGGFFLESAEDVCKGEELARESIAELIRSLAQKSLIERIDSECGPRFRLLETVREYGMRVLREQDDIDCLRDFHLDYFAEFAQKVYAGFKTSEQSFWNRRSRLDLDNFRAALAWSFERAEQGALHHTIEALKLLGGIANYLYWQGLGSEAHAGMERAILCSDKLLEDQTIEPVQREELEKRQVLLFRRIGFHLEAIDETQAALDILNRGLAAAVRFGDLHEEGWTRMGLAMCYFRLWRLEDIPKELHRALEIAEKQQISHLLCICYEHLGFLAMAHGDMETAEQYLQKAFDVATNLQNPSRKSAAMVWLGEFAYLQGQNEECIRLARESLCGLVETGFLAITPYAIEIVAAALAELRNMADACRLFGAGERLRNVLCKLRDRDPHRVRIFEGATGKLRLSLGDAYDEFFEKGAELNFEQAVELALHAPYVVGSDVTGSAFRRIGS